MGNRSRCTPKVKQAILESLQRGSGYERAARAAGISGAALRLWRRADPVFAEACKAATDYAVDVAENVLYDRGIKTETLALLAWLRANCPEKYHRKLLVFGDPENPVTVSHSVSQPRILILPDNHRPALSEAEIIAEREAVARENMIDLMPPAETVVVAEEAEAEVDDTEQAEPDGWQTITIKQRP
jgi:hypothetical protein